MGQYKHKFDHTFDIRMNKKMIGNLRKIAKKESRNCSEIIRQAIMEYMKKYEKMCKM